MYNILVKLISNRFYSNAQEAYDIIGTFFACKQITAEQYAELVQLIEQVYGNIPSLHEGE